MRSGSAGAGIQQLERAFGRQFIPYPTKNGAVDVRVTAVNARLMTPEGVPQVYVNQERCPRLHNGLLRQTKNEKGEPDKTKGLDHSLDGFGYMVVRLFPPIGQSSPVKLVGV
jgi:hypothetical protein